VKFLAALDGRARRWARHPHAAWYLGGLSFAESAFLPVPPEVMLAPISLAHPERAWRLAAVTTLASVLGGLLGYGMGALAFDLVQPLLHRAGYWPAYLRAQQWFSAWGFWAVLLAGFAPIPYKVFTISAGVIGMSLIPFTLASFVGRGARFFLVAAVMLWGGRSMEGGLRGYLDRVGWILAVAVLVVLLLYRD
jgi:membrane protein YqaA with SNARE-associated domain